MPSREIGSQQIYAFFILIDNNNNDPQNPIYHNKGAAMITGTLFAALTLLGNSQNSMQVDIHRVNQPIHLIDSTSVILSEKSNTTASAFITSGNARSINSPANASTSYALFDVEDCLNGCNTSFQNDMNNIEETRLARRSKWWNPNALADNQANMERVLAAKARLICQDGCYGNE